MSPPLRKSWMRRGTTLIECLAVIGLTGIVLTTTSMTLARVGALNHAAGDVAVVAETRHRLLTRLRRDVHAARDAAVREDQSLWLQDLADGREQVSYSLQALRQQGGWSDEVVWRVKGSEVTIQPSPDSPATSVLFAAGVNRCGRSARESDSGSQEVQNRLPPIESLDQLREARP